MPNKTMDKFGFPRTLVADVGAWSVLVRPQQPTLGSLVLVCREPAGAFSELSAGAFADLRQAVAGIERTLKSFVSYEKINYLMLMMVDPDVHFHVIPRYGEVRSFAGASYPDAGWPGPPKLAEAVDPAGDFDALIAALKTAWNDA